MTPRLLKHRLIPLSAVLCVFAAWLLLRSAEPVPMDSPDSSEPATEPPADWARLDARSNLIVTPALRQLFEYYLSAPGEETLEQVVMRIEQVRARALDPLR